MKHGFEHDLIGEKDYRIGNSMGASYGVRYDRVKREDGDITNWSDYDNKFENIRIKKRKGKQPWEFHHLTGKHVDNTNLVKEEKAKGETKGVSFGAAKRNF
jgi:hypothetical protein